MVPDERPRDIPLADGLSRELVEAARPRDLVFTLFGEYLLKRSDSVWVGSLIALLEPFGLTEGTVRTALSRMVKKGWLEARRDGRHSYYSLTPRGRRLLEEGTERIFHPAWPEHWDGHWFLLAYSIAQGNRSLRDRLRDRLAWLGFGSIGNGVWVSPHDVGPQVAEVAESLGLGNRYVGFRAQRVAGESVDDIVARCWDLEALAAGYREFTKRWAPLLAGVASTAPAVERCFALRFDLIHEYRRFPLEDPYLPRTLLPDPWAGDAAADVFRDLHDRLVGPADAHVDAVLAEALAA
jgi:phenylacetic acid degradation operon negative regulatory protein